MAALPILDDLPPGFAVRRGSRGILALRAEAEQALAECGFTPDADGALRPCGLYGRQPLAAIESGTERYVVRAFSHGGLLRWLTGRRFCDPERPFLELVFSERLRSAGIPTPEVVAARAQPARWFGWQLALVTRRVEGAIDLGHLLGRYRRGELEPARLRGVLCAAGELVRRLHELGFWHADLNPNNVLVGLAPHCAAEPELWVLDLDRSVLAPNLARDRRLKNLRRLYRHVLRREERHGACLARTDFARFLRAYAPEHWKEEWRAIAAVHARRSVLHRLGWWIEERASRSADPRHGLG